MKWISEIIHIYISDGHLVIAQHVYEFVKLSRVGVPILEKSRRMKSYSILVVIREKNV